MDFFRIKKEFHKQSMTAITAAFGFLIALSWKDPITDLVTNIVNNLNLSNQLVYYKFLLAVIVTFICVIFLVILSKWSTDNNSS